MDTQTGNPLIIEVPSELFAVAEGSSFEGAYNPGEFDFGPDHYRVDRPFKWTAFISNVGGALLIEGQVEGRVSTDCPRCLEPASFEIQSDIEGYIVIPGQSEAPEDMDEDEFDILDESNTINMETYILAAVKIDLPLVPLCDEDCKGLCSRCGANLNLGACSCQAVQDDIVRTASGKPSQFAALKDFKFE